MGIKNINRFLKKKCNTGISNIHIKKLNHKYIGIDTSIYLYKYTYIGNVLDGFLKQIRHLLQNNIIPIYFFDGKPTIEKSDLIKKRNDTYQKALDKIQDLENQKNDLLNIDDPSDEMLFQIQMLEQKILKKKKCTIRINKDKLNYLKVILDNLGIFYYQCDGEADLFMKSFIQKNLLDYVMTEDLDFLTHGCSNILYNYNYNSNSLKLYNLKKILSDLDIEYNSFIDLCIMIGCDYSCKIPGIGPAIGYKLIKKYKRFNNLITNNIINIPNDFKYIESFNMFFNKPDININNKKDLRFKIQNINIDNLRKFDLNMNLIFKITDLIRNFKFSVNILDFLQ
jgi:flap endonuclease-1